MDPQAFSHSVSEWIQDRALLLLVMSPILLFVLYNYLKWQYQLQGKQVNKEKFALGSLLQIGEILGALFSFSTPNLKEGFANLGNWDITISPYRYNMDLASELPWKASIVKKLDIYYDDHFYLVKLNKPHRYKGYVPDYVLLTKMKDYGIIEAGSKYIMQLFLIPPDIFVNNDVQSQKGLGDLGYIIMTNDWAPDPTLNTSSPNDANNIR